MLDDRWPAMIAAGRENAASTPYQLGSIVDGHPQRRFNASGIAQRNLGPALK
jgi:hypothetical protein